MKSCFLLLAILALACPALGQQPATAPPLITTTGTAQIHVTPDLADLYFEVEVRNADLRLARTQQAERAVKVLAVLRAAGITEAELQSSQVQISPNYTDRTGDTSKLQYYRVTQTISATLHDLKKISDVTADAVTAGASGVKDATLRTSDLRKHRDEARARAIRAAREKAAALATELGAKIGRPYSITEGTNDWSLVSNNSVPAQTGATVENQAGDDAPSAFASGTISITANVTVAFLLE